MTMTFIDEFLTGKEITMTFIDEFLTGKEIDECMVGEDDVPCDLEQKCQTTQSLNK